MNQTGFIHDDIDIKVLVLYLTGRLEYPVDMDELTELSMCDNGVRYFELAQAVEEMVESGHLKMDQGLYTITETGRRDMEICQDQLAYSLRQKCDRNLAAMNVRLREEAQTGARVLPQPDGSFIVRLRLTEKDSVLLYLELSCAVQEDADRIAASFKKNPHQAYRDVLAALLKEKKEDK